MLLFVVLKLWQNWLYIINQCSDDHEHTELLLCRMVHSFTCAGKLPTYIMKLYNFRNEYKCSVNVKNMQPSEIL